MDQLIHGFNDVFPLVIGEDNPWRAISLGSLCHLDLSGLGQVVLCQLAAGVANVLVRSSSSQGEITTRGGVVPGPGQAGEGTSLICVCGLPHIVVLGLQEVEALLELSPDSLVMLRILGAVHGSVLALTIHFQN